MLFSYRKLAAVSSFGSPSNQPRISLSFGAVFPIRVMAMAEGKRFFYRIYANVFPVCTYALHSVWKGGNLPASSTKCPVHWCVSTLTASWAEKIAPHMSENVILSYKHTKIWCTSISDSILAIMGKKKATTVPGKCVVSCVGVCVCL